jgi:hypothetical protein
VAACCSQKGIRQTKFLGSVTASGVNMLTLDWSVLQTGLVPSSSASKVVIANGFFGSFTSKALSASSNLMAVRLPAP